MLWHILQNPLPVQIFCRRVGLHPSAVLQSSSASAEMPKMKGLLLLVVDRSSQSTVCTIEESASSNE